VTRREVEMRRTADYDPVAERRSGNVELKAASEEMDALVEAATREGRDLTRSEIVRFDKAELRAGRARIQVSEADEWLQRHAPQRQTDGSGSGNDGGYGEAIFDDDERRSYSRWMGAELRALVEGSGSGSYVVPDRYKNSIVDRLRAKSIGLQSGFTVLETDGDTLHVPKVTGDIAAAWTSEGNAITPADPTFAEDIAVPRKLAGLTIVSNELIADSNPSGAVKE
jgi:HK97 family phage major capsid protein